MMKFRSDRMDFPSPLIRGHLLRRYKRFLADILLDDGTEITAHCPNPGAMIGLNLPGLTCWLSKSPDPKRKLPYTWELVEVPNEISGGTVIAGLNTLHPNRLVAEALALDLVPELTGYASVRREVNYGANSRVDFLLESPDRPPCWLEIKNCHLSRTPGLAEFPDCVAARSSKHLRELAAMVEEGHRAVALFVVQRTDCETFSACAELDPVFARTLDEVAARGVEVLVYACDMGETAIRIARRLEWLTAP
jgi:sugar fermentation stimulation protein A